MSKTNPRALVEFARVSFEAIAELLEPHALPKNNVRAARALAGMAAEVLAEQERPDDEPYFPPAPPMPPPDMPNQDAGGVPYWPDGRMERPGRLPGSDR